MRIVYCLCVSVLCVSPPEDVLTSVSACVYPKCVVSAVRLSVHIILYAACVCSLDGVIKRLLSSRFSRFRVTIKMCAR